MSAEMQLGTLAGAFTDVYGIGITIADLCSVTDAIDNFKPENYDKQDFWSVYTENMLEKHPMPECYSLELRRLVKAMTHNDYR